MLPFPGGNHSQEAQELGFPRGRLDYPELVLTAWRKVWRHKPYSELPELLSSCANYGLKACRYQ